MDLQHDSRTTLSAGEEERLYRRYEEAVARANLAQASLYDAAVAGGSIEPRTMTEEVLTTLLSDRAEPIVDVREWREEVPLVLVVTDYAPYTTMPAPLGNVAWIDPSDDERYRASLAALGLAELGQVEPGLAELGQEEPGQAEPASAASRLVSAGHHA